MKILTLNKKVFEGESAETICWKLWNSMLKPNKSFERWMKSSARRARNWNGCEVRCTNADEHLADLIAGKIVKVLEA